MAYDAKLKTATFVFIVSLQLYVSLHNRVLAQRMWKICRDARLANTIGLVRIHVIDSVT
jgi:hypothetical protein